jgi:hypothetical protein
MARKSDATAGGWLIVIGIIIAPFVLLYEAVGQFWFWIIVLGIPMLVIIWRIFQKPDNETKRQVHTNMVFDPKDGMTYLETDWDKQFKEIDKAISQGDFNFARIWLQKFAYTVTGNTEVPAWVQYRFKQMMTEFANKDPLYAEVIAVLSPYVIKNSGLLQSEIYNYFPSFDKETIRYVLYFASELGHITRIKKGSSYILMPSNDVLNQWQEEIAESHRQATRYKDQKDWVSAIECLKDAQDKMRKSASCSVDRCVRLPVFLQQGGRFDEAMLEFNKLLDEADAVAAWQNRNQPKFIQNGTAHHIKATVYDKMRVACTRQKLPDEAHKYAILSNEFSRKHQQFMVKWEKHRQAEYKNREEEKAKQAVDNNAK